jgi:hypothetical protein
MITFRDDIIPRLELSPWPESGAALPTSNVRDSFFECFQFFRRHRLGRGTRCSSALRHGGWIKRGICVALSAIRANWDQHKSVTAFVIVKISATGRDPNAANLAAIVHGKRFHQLQARVGRSQRIQVNHRAVFPQERAQKVGSTGERLADDLVSRIYGKRLAEAIVVHSPKIPSHTFPPEVCVGEGAT